jgi:S1-C subfamily serine protease
MRTARVRVLLLGVMIGAFGLVGSAAAQMQDRLTDKLAPMTTGVQIVPKFVLGIEGTIGPRGVLIEKVMTGTVAEQLGLLPGAWVVQVNGSPIDSCDAWAVAVNENDGKALLLIRSGETGALLQIETTLPKADSLMPVRPRPRP